MPTAAHRIIATLIAISAIVLAPLAQSDPVSTIPYRSFAGNLDFITTGGSLRTQPNSANACAVSNSNSAVLSGIPVTASIRAAYLYWAGSGPTVDDSVTFNGASVLADRTFTETYAQSGFNLQFFSGFEDVTAQVSATRNGTYTFADLSVTNTNIGAGQNYCSVQAVLAGWGLIVIYDDAAEPLRVLNLFDGFEYFRGNQIRLTPDNFVTPATGVDGKLAVLSWEGDVQNSAPFGGVSENLTFDGQATPPVLLTDGFNPINNQYNSTVNAIPSNTTYGVDFDTYDISTRLRPGDTAAQTIYASGGDLVILSAEIFSATNEDVADLSLSKTHPGNLSAGQTNNYLLTVTNNGPVTDSNPITLTDTVTAPLTYVSAGSSDPNWSCANAGATVTCTHPGPLAVGASHAPVTLSVNVPLTAGPTVANTASVSSATFDHIIANNSSTLTAPVVVSDLSTSSNSVVDLNGGDAQPGDVLRYTVTINEAASAAVSGVSLTDLIGPLLENVAVVDAGGGTDNSTPGSVVINGLAVPAGGSITVIFDAQIVATANAGDVIANIASITNPANATITSATAADVVVGATSIPGSGIKNVYLDDFAGSESNPTIPMPMSRIPLTAPSSPQRVRIRVQDNDRFWHLNPALAAPLEIDSGAIPIVLQLRRAGNSSTRTVRVTLDYLGGSSGFVGCQTLAIPGSGPTGLSNSVTRAFNFNVQRTDANCNPVLGSPITLTAGTVLRMHVDNLPIGGTGSRAIYVYPFNNNSPDTSRVELPANTVINVDSVAVFDAPFPGGTAQASYLPGSIVSIRAEVSDPFGSFDITAANIEILDSAATPMVTAAMTEVASTAAGKTYEFGYTIPAAAAYGDWTARVTAAEGTEGTISHQGVTTFVVGGTANDASIVLSKSVRAVSDPITGTLSPKSIPGAVMEYTITATNTGPAAVDADSVNIAEQLPADVILLFGSPPNPIAFTDGTVASGLTYSFVSLSDTGDDIAFSNDGGTTFITPTVDPVSGVDLSSPSINFVEITPKGQFNAPSTGDPSFSLTLQVLVR